jgi:hypothetical protein
VTVVAIVVVTVIAIVVVTVVVTVVADLGSDFELRVVAGPARRVETEARATGSAIAIIW